MILMIMSYTLFFVVSCYTVLLCIFGWQHEEGDENREGGKEREQDETGVNIIRWSRRP